MSDTAKSMVGKTGQQTVRAAALVEYAILIGFVSVGSMGAIAGAGAKVNDGFNTTAAKIENATGFLTPAGLPIGPVPGNAAPTITSMFFNSDDNLANGGAGAIYLSDTDGDTISVSFTGPGGAYFTPFSNGSSGYNTLNIGSSDIPPGVPIVFRVEANDGAGGVAVSDEQTLYYVEYDLDTGCPDQSQSPEYTLFTDTNFLFEGTTTGSANAAINYILLRNANAASLPTVIGANANTFTVAYNGRLDFQDDAPCPVFEHEWEISRTASTPPGLYTDIQVQLTDNWGQIWTSNPLSFTAN